MAYNPFDVFRRNQKILFAIITVFVMFTFVLSFGRGDFFDWLPRWLGSKQKSGDVMANLDGRKVYESDLNEVLIRRRAANQFMMQAMTVTAIKMDKYVRDQQEKVSQANKNIIARAMSVRDPQTRNLWLQIAGPVEGAQRLNQMMMEAEFGLNSIITDAAAKPDDKDVADVLRRLMMMERRIAESRDTFFVNQPYKTNRDHMDFLLWLKKADSLGIQFADDDLDQLIDDDLPRLTKQDKAQIFDELSKTTRGATRAFVTESLLNEYRVLSAQMAVIGAGEARSFSGGYGAPYDMYSLYRTLSTPHTYSFISVPVENYLHQVKGSPSESEIQEIFNRTKMVEPDPASPKPGIKEPRKLKLQWLEATGEEPYYKAAVEKRMQMVDFMAKAGGPLMEAFSGSPLSATVSAWMITRQEPLFTGAYEGYKSEHENHLTSRWYNQLDRNFDKGLLSTSVASPGNVGVLAGILGSSLATNAPLATAPLALAAAADRTERLQRLQSALALLPAPILPHLGEFVATAVTHAASLPQPLPVTAVRASLIEGVQEKLKYTVCEQDLEQFRTELMKQTNGSKDKAAEANKLIDEFIKSRGFRTGKSAQFADQHTIGDDAGLLPLSFRFKDPHRGMQGGEAKFGRRFFFTPAPSRFGMGPEGPEKPTTTFFDPQPYPNTSIGGLQSGQSQFLVWRFDEQPAKAPESRAAATPKVIEVWRYQQARKLAKAAAEELTKKLSNCGDNPAAIRAAIKQTRTEFVNGMVSGIPEAADRLTAELRVISFERPEVAPMVIRSLPGNPPMVTANRFILAKGDDIPYPNDKMQSDLLAMNNKPLGTAGLLVDAPEARYYVAVLTETKPQGEKVFEERIFPAPANASQASNVVKQNFMFKVLAENREAAITLLKSEFRYDNENPKVNEKNETSFD